MAPKPASSQGPERSLQWAGEHFCEGDTLQASAEDGASSIDVAAYRSSNGQIVRLDNVQAKAVADASIKAAAVPGLRVWTVTVIGSRVTVAGTLSVQLMVLGTATLSESRSAMLAYGQ